MQGSWLVQIVPVIWRTRRSRSRLERFVQLLRRHSSVSLTVRACSKRTETALHTALFWPSLIFCSKCIWIMDIARAISQQGLICSNFTKDGGLIGTLVNVYAVTILRWLMVFDAILWPHQLKLSYHVSFNIKWRHLENEKHSSTSVTSMSVLVILGTEMYTGRVACCPWWVTLIIAARSIEVRKRRTEQTDGRTDAVPLRYAYRLMRPA